MWTDRVFDRAGGEALDPFLPPSPPPLPRFRGRSVGLVAVTLSGLLAAFACSLLLVLADIGLGRPGGVLAELVVSELGLWSALLATCLLVSRRFGTRSLRQDLGIRFRPVDPGVGVVAALAAHLIAGLVLLPIVLNSRHIENPDSSLFSSTTISAAGWAVLVLVTCVGAPFVEELYFRGLLQGVLTERIGTLPGIAATAVVFGAAHIANDPGVSGLVFALGIGASGLVLGCVRLWTNHLGASIATHCAFNAMAVIALAVSLSR